MSGDMAYITCCLLYDYESPLGSASNLRLNSRFQNERGIDGFISNGGVRKK